ncbi:MAG: hypothetical protein ABSE20_27130 [Acetobacteraceae bacterium]|jgi:hypothetical protein
MMQVRIILQLALVGLLAATPASAKAPLSHAAAPPFHAAGVAGPGMVGGPPKQQPGVLIGKPIMNHH